MVESHYTGSCTYLEAVRRVTGYARVRPQQIKAFEVFYIVSHPRYDEWYESDYEEELAAMKKANSVPLKTVAELFAKVWTLAKGTPATYRNR